MTDINAIGTDSTELPAATGSMKTLGKDDFLRLLVAKMEHQDPLDPMGDEDFIAQLAQFSSLEQMNNIADGIEKSNEFDFLQMQSINNTMAAGLIGKEVEASFQGIYVENGQPVKLNFTNTEFAPEMKFDILDESGTPVTSIWIDDVQTGPGSVDWDARDSIGNTVPDGYYTVQATGYAPNGSEFSPMLAMVGVVDSITYRDGGAFLRVDGTEIALGDVSTIRGVDQVQSNNNTGAGSNGPHHYKGNSTTTAR